MREFIYFSGKARTSGNFKDLMKAGRMDIVCNVIIHAFFLSHALRENVSLHLIFYGQPDPPKHIELRLREESSVSKKDISGLLKRMLYKYKEGKKTEAFPGCFVEKKSFLNVVSELEKQGKEIFILDKNGEDIRKIIDEELKNAVFILGYQEGLPKKELRRLKNAKKISLGKKTYFASQALVIVNNELDRRENESRSN
jgi:tRNA (pseudouridine54-N1)-methyltransferase